MKVTLWPMNTLSSIVTPSQIKLWLETLQFFPTVAFFWISTNAPIFVFSPIWQPYRLINLESLTPEANFTSGAIEQNSFTIAPTFLAFAWNTRLPIDSQKKITPHQAMKLSQTVWVGYRH